MIPSKWSYADMLENLASLSNTLMASALTGAQAKDTLTCERRSDHEVAILYKSPRKLCSFGKGVLYALAEQYKTHLNIEETRCMLHGDALCEIICSIQEDGTKAGR